MTRAIALTFLFVLAACDRGFGGGQAVADSSGGEVTLSDGGTLSYSITSDRYKQWDQARKGIDKRTSKRFGDLLQPASPSERSISRATAFLESAPRARQAIERAGMSVRAFVEMTVALEQEMRLASGRGSPRVEPTPMPSPYPPPIDSSGIPESPVPVTPLPPPADTTPRIDTAFVPRPVPSLPLVPRDTAPKRDTLKKDTIPKRDTLAVPTPLPRDTVRDTTRAPVIPDPQRRA